METLFPLGNWRIRGGTVCYKHKRISQSPLVPITETESQVSKTYNCSTLNLWTLPLLSEKSTKSKNPKSKQNKTKHKQQQQKLKGLLRTRRVLLLSALVSTSCEPDLYGFEVFPWCVLERALALVSDQWGSGFQPQMALNLLAPHWERL